MGLMARHLEDIDLLIGELLDDWASISARGPLPVSRAQSDVRIGFFDSDGVVPVAADVRSAVAVAVDGLSDRFAVDRCAPPGLSSLYEIWDGLWMASGGARGLLSGYLKGDEALSPALARLVAMSPAQPDERYLAEAAEQIQAVRSEMITFMDHYPVIICPVAAGPPGEHVGRWTIEGVELSGSRGFGYCYVWSLLGFPAVAVALAGEPSKPRGVQVVARPGRDEEAMGVALAIMANGTARQVSE
jgi:amidase